MVIYDRISETSRPPTPNRKYFTLHLVLFIGGGRPEAAPPSAAALGAILREYRVSAPERLRLFEYAADGSLLVPKYKVPLRYDAIS